MKITSENKDAGKFWPSEKNKITVVKLEGLNKNRSEIFIGKKKLKTQFIIEEKMSCKVHIWFSSTF